MDREAFGRRRETHRFDVAPQLDGGLVALDPEAVAELRRLLEGVEGLWRPTEVAVRTPAARGSLAAKDAVLPDARFVTICAGQALVVAIDHLNTWRLLVNGPRIPILAHLTLLRGALEGAARCRWHVERQVSPGTRVGRGLAARRDDQIERGLFESTSEGRRNPVQPRVGLSAAERLAELDAEEAVRTRGEAGVRSVGYADTTSLMMKYRHERWFRLASAAAHGKEWALAATSLQPSADAPLVPGVRHGMISVSAPVAIAMTKVAVGAVRTALADLEAYQTGATRVR